MDTYNELKGHYHKSFHPKEIIIIGAKTVLYLSPFSPNYLGTILGILRDDKLGRGYKVLSYEGGCTWKGPFPTQLIGLNGRLKAGLLRSGEICITYRAGLPNEMLALYTITQKACEVEGDYTLIECLPIPEEIESMRNDANCPWYMKEYYPFCRGRGRYK